MKADFDLLEKLFAGIAHEQELVLSLSNHQLLLKVHQFLAYDSHHHAVKHAILRQSQLNVGYLVQVYGPVQAYAQSSEYLQLVYLLQVQVGSALSLAHLQISAQQPHHVALS